MRTLVCGVVCVLLDVLAIQAAEAGDIIVGVNVYDETYFAKPGQDAEIKGLAEAGVKTIRTGLGANTIYFITQAYQHGIGTVAIVYPDLGSRVSPKGSGSGVPLSRVKPQGFAEWLKPLLDQLDAAGVRLTAIELGNEINTSRFNGDVALREPDACSDSSIFTIQGMRKQFPSWPATGFIGTLQKH
jgi:hypothetical protein